MLIWLVVILLLFLLSRTRPLDGAGEKRNLVVDCLNIMHYLGLPPEDLPGLISATKKASKFEGLHVFVIKDRDGTPLDEGFVESLEELANRERVVISLAAKTNEPAKARDDMLACWWAQKIDAPILTNDKMRDLNKWPALSFYAHVFEPNKVPTRDWINATKMRTRGPQKIRPSDFFELTKDT